MTPIFSPIVEQSERYFAEHGDNNFGVGWPSADSAEVHYRVISDLVPRSSSPVSVLDFGCGLGGLLEYLQRNGRDDIRYTGLDVSDTFLQAVRSKFPQTTFLQLDILQQSEALPEFDYILANGIFTQRCELSFDDMWAYMQQLLRLLWPKCRRGLAFNMMSKHLDWEREDLFHLPMDPLAAFLREHLSRRIVFRHEYGYYDYTAYVYRS